MPTPPPGAASGKAADLWFDRLRERRAAKWDSFSWVTVKALFESVNDVFAKARPEIIDERRLRWIAQLRASAKSGNEGKPFTIDLSGPERGARGFFLIGDTGEQDASQYAAIPLLEGWPNQTGPTYRDPDGNQVPPEFMLIVSDVIYPAGSVNEYYNGFYLPYREFPAPIYAIPGNHDWYDGLNGFMFNFCGAEPLAHQRYRQTEVGVGSRVTNWLWRGSEEPHRAALGELRDERSQGRDEQKAVQPGPYFATDLGDLMLVGIDTGVTGPIDDEQGRWLLEISRIPKQKILLTGKPICVDDSYHPGEIHWKPSAWGDVPKYATVDEIVRDEAFGYVAAIGGDIHNYQRYPMRVSRKDGGTRTIYYLVSGGGGAYLSPTHRIPAVGDPRRESQWPWPEGMIPPRDEDLGPGEGDAQTFAAYPTRGESLEFVARNAGPRLFNALHGLTTVLLLAAALVLFDVAPHGAVTRAGTAVAYLSLLLLGLGVLALVRAGRGRTSPGTGALPSGRLAIGLCAAMVVIGLGAWAADGLSNADLLVDGRFWATVGLSLAIPVLLIVCVIASHDLRHAAPASLSAVLTATAYAAAIPILWTVHVDGVPDWLAVTVLIAAVIGLGSSLLILGRNRWLLLKPEDDDSGRHHTPVHDPDRRPIERTAGEPRLLRRRCSLPYFVERALFIAGPGLLAAALLRESGESWIAGLAIAVTLAAGVPFGLALVLKTHHGPPLVDPGSNAWRRWQAASMFAIGGAWVIAALALDSLASDGWLARAAVGAPAVLILFVAIAVLAALAIGSRSVSSWLPPLAAVAMLVAAGLAEFLDLWDFSWAMFAVFGAVIYLVSLAAVWRLRRGQLGAENAQKRVESVLQGTEPSELTKEEKSLFKRLYRYRPDHERQQGAANTNSVAQGVAALLAELGDSDRPPFPKHLLRCDVRAHSAESGEDMELVIRCFRFTGEEDSYASSAEPIDTLRIPFHSRRQWELQLSLEHAEEEVRGYVDGVLSWLRRIGAASPPARAQLTGILMELAEFLDTHAGPGSERT